MKRENVETIYRLTPVQQGMLFHTLTAPSTGAYFDQFVVPLKGLDLEIFRRVWERLVAHHAALRTGFLWQGLEEPVQIVYKKVELPFSVEDLGGLPAAEQEARIAEYGATERRAGFDLVRPPLLKLRVFRLGDAERLVWSYHHVILDGWSSALLLRQVLELYPAAVRGVEAPLESSRPFQDYVRWLARQNGNAAESYWRETLADFDAPTWVGLDRGTPGAPAGEGFGLRKAVFPAADAAALQDAAKRFRVSVHTLVEAAWALTLARFSGRRDMVFGVTFAGRPAELPGVQTMAGCFVNTLPVRVRIDPGATIGDWLGELHRARTALLRHQHTSLVEIRAWSDMPGNLPLFESLVVSDSFVGERKSESFQRTNYPLALNALIGRDEFRLHLGFDRDRFGDAEGGRLARFTAHTLRALADTEPRKLSDLLELPAAERHLVSVEWNGAPAACPADAPLHRLFERRADETPDATAVVCGEETLTYRELDHRANALARRLREIGVGADALVGLYAERSLDLVVAILGILKAGAAYVPLDPAYPRERLAFILGDARVAALVSQEALSGDLPETAGPVVFLDGLGSDERRPTGGATPESLAYVIYTSGSTGKPKGSPIAHKNVARLFAATEDAFGFGPGDVWTLFHSCAFDFSVWELWGALLYGGRLVVVPYWVSRSPEDFLELLRREKVTILNQTPSAFRQLAEAEAESGGGELALREVVFGGEALDVESLRPWMVRHGERPRLVNMYGITETTVHVTYRPLRTADLDADGSRSPLGRAIPDLSLRLLDRDGWPVPLGVPGELCVGGAGPGRGYLGRPGLTAERFVPDPWSREGGGRLYRSGDLARYLADGDLEYLGRIDHQVKVRGFRIELGEIEQVLAEQPGVGQAVVLARDAGPGESQLVAWLAVGDGEAPPEAALRQALRRKLPDYMVPAFFEVAEALPLTAHGKVDRAALGRKALAKQVGPGHGWTSPTEEVLAGIWNDVLGVAPESPSASFFELGGHSLLATRVAARIRQAFGVDVPLERLFRLPVLAELAREVEGRAAGTADMPPIVPRTTEDDEDLPLSFAQERLWLLDRLQPESAMYNVPVGLDVAGNLSVPALRASLATITERHEPLRTHFRYDGVRPYQVVEPPGPVDLPVVDLGGLPEERRTGLLRRLAAEEAARPFDLAKGPLLRTVLLRHTEDRHRLLMTLHHAVTDGASMGILLRELTALYDARHRGEPARLPELPVQYADFALWQRRWLEGGELERQLAYWRERLAGLHDFLELPADRARSALVTSRGAAVPSAWPRPLREGLEAFSRAHSTTLFMTLLAAFQILLGRLTGRRDLTVGSPVANRRRLETEGLIGFFVNTLVLRAELRDEASFAGLLEETRRSTLDAYGRQDVPFEALVAELAPERNLHHTPLFQVMLSLEDDVAATWTAGDLELRPLLRSSGTAKFDLNVQLRNGAAGLFGAWEYHAELFDAVTVRRFARAFRVLLEGVLEDPKRTLPALPLLAAAERHQLIVEKRPDDAPDGSCLHELFTEQVRLRGDEVAVTSGETSLTYAELDRQARHLARRLNIGPESRVGILAERGPEIVVGAVGVLMAGGAYVPIDPSYPEARRAYLVEDAGVEVLLTGPGVEVPDFDGPVLALDDDSEAPETELPDIDPDHPAYVIYTSGSTGKPKGVVVTHRNATRLLASTDAAFGFGPDDVWTLFHSFAFDFSVWEIWGALAYGGRLVVVPYWVSRSPEAFCRLLGQEGVTVLNQTPSAFRQLIAAEAEIDGTAAKKLRYVIFGGEALPIESLQPWVERHGDGTNDDGPALVNMYGITETTVHVTWREIRSAETRAGGASPIGAPIPDLGIYLLDRRSRPVPLGVPGEIAVAGAGLARGYLGRPGLTAERFVPDPFSGVPGARLYKSGDLGRYRAGGDLVYLGRIDQQVKVRGFRVELGEIESTLALHPAVREAVVMARREKRREDLVLVAYFVAEGEPPAEGVLRDFLKDRLPEHMVPSWLVPLAALPLTAHGKVDRKALPEPEAPEPGPDFVEPRDALEIELTQLWEEVFERRPIGVRDTFFSLGGHSLLAAHLVTEVARRFGQEVPLIALFQEPTIESLAAALRLKRVHSPIVALQREGGAEPFICVHPLLGDVLCYRRLANFMGEDRPFLAVQSPGLLSGGSAGRDIGEIADLYIREIRSVQPVGPYLLGGWSFGGAVAFEMACRLLESGESVAFLAILDSGPDDFGKPEAKEGKELDEAELAIHFFEQLIPFAMEGLKEDLIKVNKADRLDYIVQRWRDRRLVPPDFSIASARTYLATTEAHLQAALSWRARPYPGRLDLFSVRGEIEDPTLGWGAFAADVRIHEVEGNHGHLVFPPYVEKLAQTIREQIEWTRS